MFRQCIFLLISFIIVAFGEPSRVPFLGIVASCIGYAIFWKGMLSFQNRKTRFFLSLTWMLCVTLVHVSWMSSIEFVGPWILGGYFVVGLIVASQFALFSLFVSQQLSWQRIFMLGGLWVLLEYSRHYMLSGYFWNPVGHSLTSTVASMQLVSLFGLYGLSFICIVTNLLALTLKWKSFIVFSLSPYFLGGLLFLYHANQIEKNKEELHVVLVQTAVLPDQTLLGVEASPLDQWQNILMLLKEHQGKKIDLIALPEGAVPYPAMIPFYSYFSVFESFSQIYGIGATSKLPMLKAPLADFNHKRWLTTNIYWAQAIANLFDAEVILGMEDAEKKSTTYQAAFHVQPGIFQKIRYDKRILVPIGEYIPFEWCKDFSARFGIYDSFKEGAKAELFRGKVNSSVSICYEETRGQLVREGRLLGADLFVNITNDGWYPGERLPKSHFYHGRVRACENGVPLIRSCNTGLTCAVDSIGRIVDHIPSEKFMTPAALYVKVPLYAYATLYTFWGDAFILVVSVVFVLFGIYESLKNRASEKSILEVSSV